MFIPLVSLYGCKFFYTPADCPKIITHLEELKDTVPDKPASPRQLEAVRPHIYGAYKFKVEMAKLQVAKMNMLETEMREKDDEIDHLRRDLRQVQVKKPCSKFVTESDSYRWTSQIAMAESVAIFTHCWAIQLSAMSS